MRLLFGLLAALHLVSVSSTSDGGETDWSKIEPIVQAGIDAGEMPGAVVVVANQQKVLYRKAFGDRQVLPTREPMTVDTVFDMASITKPVATATSVMILVQQQKIDVNQPVSLYLPEFAAAGKQEITVADLLLHVGGLIPDNALRDYESGITKAWENIWALEPRSPRGEKFSYTDVGFLVLGKLVERISGQPLDEFASEQIFEPLAMRQTGYRPIRMPASDVNDSLKDKTLAADGVLARIAPTEQRDGHLIRGEVHDPRAYLLKGVAGHAGLFSTADDLVRYGRMMLGRGELDGVRILNAETFELMTEPRIVPRGTRTYGWDHRSPYSRNRGSSFSDRAFGHGGFTGTVLWIDPGKNLVFVFLSNRLHPDGKGTVNALAGEIATLIAE